MRGPIRTGQKFARTETEKVNFFFPLLLNDSTCDKIHALSNTVDFENKICKANILLKRKITVSVYCGGVDALLEDDRDKKGLR